MKGFDQPELPVDRRPVHGGLVGPPVEIIPHHVAEVGAASGKLQKLPGKHVVCFSPVLRRPVICHIDRPAVCPGEQLPVYLPGSEFGPEPLELYSKGLRSLQGGTVHQLLDSPGGIRLHHHR